MQRIKLILTLKGGVEVPLALDVGTSFDPEDAVSDLIISKAEWWVDANGNAVRASSVIAVKLA